MKTDRLVEKINYEYEKAMSICVYMNTYISSLSLYTYRSLIFIIENGAGACK